MVLPDQLWPSWPIAENPVLAINPVVAEVVAPGSEVVAAAGGDVTAGHLVPPIPNLSCGAMRLLTELRRQNLALHPSHNALKLEKAGHGRLSGVQIKELLAEFLSPWPRRIGFCRRSLNPSPARCGRRVAPATALLRHAVLLGLAAIAQQLELPLRDS
jgi:hypothetical protein